MNTLIAGKEEQNTLAVVTATMAAQLTTIKI